MDPLDEECSVFSVNDIAAYLHAIDVQKPEIFPRWEELINHLELCAKCRKTVALQRKLQRSSDTSGPQDFSGPLGT